jgi:hypothetical protein
VEALAFGFHSAVKVLSSDLDLSAAPRPLDCRIAFFRTQRPDLAYDELAGLQLAIPPPPGFISTAAPTDTEHRTNSPPFSCGGSPLPRPDGGPTAECSPHTLPGALWARCAGEPRPSHPNSLPASRAPSPRALQSYSHCGGPCAAGATCVGSPA